MAETSPTFQTPDSASDIRDPDVRAFVYHGGPPPSRDRCWYRDCENRINPESQVRVCSVCQIEIRDVRVIDAKTEVIRSSLAAGVPSGYFFDARALTPTAQQEKLRALLNRIIDRSADRPWLFITGGVGTGKTIEALRAVVTTIASGRSAQFIAAEEYISRVTSAGLDERVALIDSYVGSGLLVVDDLGAEKGSQHSADTLFTLLNRRYQQKAPTIFTSNRSIRDIASHLSGNDGGLQADRIVSRMRHLAVQIRFDGSDFRDSRHDQPQRRFYELIENVERQRPRSGPRFVAMKDDDYPARKPTIEAWQHELVALVGDALPPILATPDSTAPPAPNFPRFTA